MITWEEFKTNKKYWVWAGIILILVLMVVSNCDENNNRRGANEAVNVIAISGHGEVQAVPDVASISFNITKDTKTVKEAQAQVAVVEKKVLGSLKANGVLDKDIKTTNASFNPKYDQVCVLKGNIEVPCVAVSSSQSIIYQINKIVNYEAYETISVKIRNIDMTGKIMQDLGTIGVTDLSGPNFTIDNEDALKDSARKIAIDNAQAKAKNLAKDLGIRLGKMTSYSEGGNYPTPMYANAKMMDSVAGSAPAPATLSVGENTITSDVTITYEIR